MRDTLHRGVPTSGCRLVAAAMTLAMPGGAGAWEFRARFVERVGSVDTPLENDAIDASSGDPRRIRIQFGVFDDEDGRAPGGGFISLWAGFIRVSGPEDNSDETRTPGRLAPFTFGHNHERPTWSDDPFTTITDISGSLGSQAPYWGCDADGNPSPMPPPLVRGWNSYASIYEITIDPRPGGVGYSISVGGLLRAASGWDIVGTPIPPDCDPEDGYAGSVVYVPVPLAERSIEAVLSVVVPGPGAVGAMLGGALLLTRRRWRGA